MAGWLTSTVVLADVTSFRIGGQAPRSLTVPCRSDAVIDLARGLPSAPDFVLGGGTNVLAADEGYAGVMVRYDESHTISYLGDGRYRVSANMPLDSVVDAVGVDGWAGMEQLAGIPGSVGGAVVQNAGAYDHNIGSVVEGVVAVDLEAASTIELTKDQCEFAYRDSVFKHRYAKCLITEVVLQLSAELKPVTVRAIAEKLPTIGLKPSQVSGAVRDVRRQKDHIADERTPSAGSFFKNPRRHPDAPDLEDIERQFRSRRDALVEAGILSTQTPTKVAKPVPRSSELELVTGLLISTSASTTQSPDAYVPGARIGRLRLGLGGANTIINADGALASEVVALATEMRSSVLAAYGVLLEPEVVLLGEVGQGLRDVPVQ